MKKLLGFMLIILVATAPLSAKDAFVVKNGEKDKKTPQMRFGKLPFWISFGTNLSSYPGEESEWQLGYNLGITFSFKIYKNLSMSLPLSYTRINTALENVEGKTEPWFTGENVYKTLSDWQISADFFEVPILFTYKFLTTNSYDINYVLGRGLTFAIKDYSKLKYTVTDEVLGVSQYPHSIDPETHELRSKVNIIITGVRFHISRFYVSILYTFYGSNLKGISKLYSTSEYPHGIKRINDLNSISLKLGVDIF